MMKGETIGKTIILAKRPDLVLKLEKYGVVPEGKKGGIYEGCARKWAKKRTPPYDNPEYQALAERLPTGWEELTHEEMSDLLIELREAIDKKKKAKLDTPNRGSERMLKNLSQIAFLGLSTVAALLVENGLGVLPDKDKRELEDAKEFSFELIFHLIVGTDFLTRVFRTIAETTQTNRKNQELIAEVLKMVAIFIAIMVAADGSKEKLAKLVMSFKTILSGGIDKAQKFVSEKLEGEAISGDVAENVALFLQQAHVALERNDFDGFYEAFTGALEAVDITPDCFIDDVREIRAVAKKMQELIQAGSDDGTNRMTTISQAM